MSKKDEICRLVNHLERSYDIRPSSFSPCSTCSTDGCRGSGRGGGACVTCTREKLSKIIGDDYANQILSLIVKKSVLLELVTSKGG